MKREPSSSSQDRTGPPVSRPTPAKKSWKEGLGQPPKSPTPPPVGPKPGFRKG